MTCTFCDEIFGTQWRNKSADVMKQRYMEYRSSHQNMKGDDNAHFTLRSKYVNIHWSGSKRFWSIVTCNLLKWDKRLTCRRPICWLLKKWHSTQKIIILNFNWKILTARCYNCRLTTYNLGSGLRFKIGKCLVTGLELCLW